MDADVSGHRHNEGDLSELEKVQKDLLWSSFVEYRTQARHIDTLTTTAVSTVLLLSSALTAVITLDDRVDNGDLSLCLIIMILGGLTTLFTLSFLVRHELVIHLAEIYRRELDRLFFWDRGCVTGLLATERAAFKEHQKLARYPHLTLLFWTVVSLFITIAGITLTARAMA
jgi:hypothetical protein